jgi:TctA family transporter
MEYIIWCVLGSVYGTLIGIIPVAGATTGLLTVFSFSEYFLADPYLGIVFMMSLVAASSTGDSYTSILTGIPGGGQTAASIIDGHPMALRGEASRAIGIALLDSTINGVFWGIVAFALLPYYGQVVLGFGVPEFAALLLLSFCCVGFLTSSNMVRAAISVALGLYLGLIGLDPSTSSPRLTMGWDYLDSGIQIIPMIAGLFAVPELIEGWRQRHYRVIALTDHWSQMWQGFRDCWHYRWDVVRSGVIGFVTGMLPGAGGTIGDMLSYGATKAMHRQETFGQGNPRGLAGCEGANNAQKASSMIPTILFGIPAAPFAAVMMAICVYFGIYMGSPELITDSKFVWSLGGSFVAATLITFVLGMFLSQWVVRILEVPYWIYALAISAVVIWSCMEYTGTVNDIWILIICGMIGMLCKYWSLSRPAVLLSFIVAEKFENFGQQALTLYSPGDLLQRPIVVGLLIAAVAVAYFSLKGNRK